MKKDNDEGEFKIRPRPTEVVTVDIPKETLESLKRVANSKDMSYQALLKFYIGQGLREDLARLFADRVLETTAHVLARHIESPDEVSAIIREIQLETTA
jgi:hypothetical protein